MGRVTVIDSDFAGRVAVVHLIWVGIDLWDVTATSGIPIKPESETSLKWADCQCSYSRIHSPSVRTDSTAVRDEELLRLRLGEWLNEKKEPYVTLTEERREHAIVT